MPILLVCTSMRAVQIGGASMGTHYGLNVTELDSHANMSVAGGGTTVITKSGHFATDQFWKRLRLEMRRCVMMIWFLYIPIFW